MTWEPYAGNLEDNLQELHARLHRGAYRAKPSRRVYIAKADGCEQRGRDIFGKVRELFQSPYYTLTIDDERRLICRTRLERRFETLAEAKDEFDAVTRAHEGLVRSHYSLLADVRHAPPRNDAAFEQLVGDFIQRFYGGFRRVAIVAKTQAGRLQFMRMVKVDGVPVRVFTDEAEALAFLM